MMNGDITLTVRLNPKAQGHLSELMKLHPEKSRNKLIGLAIENASIEDEKEKIAIDVMEAHYQKRINDLLTRLAQKGAAQWDEENRRMPFDSHLRLDKLYPEGRHEYLNKCWDVPYGFRWSKR